MHILVAPNAFKNSLDAVGVADAIVSGLRDSRFRGTLATCPVGDGGDGTAALMLRHWGGVMVAASVHDPLGRPIESRFALVDDGRTAIIELAEASGLDRVAVPERDPLRADTVGTGEMISAALDRGVGEILLCLGGSATVDAGTGILRALGMKFLNAEKQPLVSLPETLRNLHSIDATALHPQLASCRLTLLCDVKNPLVGFRGAAAVFGPQKGATPEVVSLLETALQRLSDVVVAGNGRGIDDLERGGAAGGVAAGLFGLLNARLVDGIDYFLERIDFDSRVAGADVVITGEGSIDDQTAGGKGPWGVGVRSRQRGAFVIGLAGRVPLHVSGALREAFDALIPIGNRSMSLAEAMTGTAEHLYRTAFELGNILSLQCRFDSGV